MLYVESESWRTTTGCWQWVTSLSEDKQKPQKAQQLVVSGEACNQSLGKSLAWAFLYNFRHCAGKSWMQILVNQRRKANSSRFFRDYSGQSSGSVLHSWQDSPDSKSCSKHSSHSIFPVTRELHTFTPGRLSLVISLQVGKNEEQFCGNNWHVSSLGSHPEPGNS